MSGVLYFNVFIVSSWAYSRWMPTVVGIGLAPIVQWVVIPPTLLFLVRARHQGGEGVRATP